MSAEPTSSSWRLHLPLELITEILKWVEVPYRKLELNEKIERPNRYSDPSNPYLISRKTLRYICLTSRTFNSVARRLLYRNVMLLHATDIVLLFRTLLEEGCANRQSTGQYTLRSNIVNLACLVTLFDEVAIRETAQAWRCLTFPQHVDPLVMTILNISHLDIGRALDEESDEFWATPQRLFGGLLGFITQLRSITLQCPMGLSDSEGYMPLDTVIRSLRQYPQIGGDILSCLTTLVVHPESGYESPRRIRHGSNLFSSFLELPTLKTLIARTCIGPLDAEEFADIGTNDLSLERVALHGSCSLEMDVERYAGLCRHLRHLEIFAPPSDVATMDVALLPVASRIESLTLRILSSTRSGFGIFSDDLGEGRVAWLRANFTRLVTLTVEDRVLFCNPEQMERIGLVHRLPTSLASLVLIEQWSPSIELSAHRLDAHFNAVACALLRASEECSEYLPNLRNFVFDRSQHYLWQGTAADSAFRGRYSEIKDAFASVDVEFVMLEPPLLDDIDTARGGI